MRLTVANHPIQLIIAPGPLRHEYLERRPKLHTGRDDAGPRYDL